MKIKLLVSRAGVGITQNRGDEIEVDDAEAVRMIEAGQAEPVRAATVETTSAKTKPEKAAK